MAQTHSKGVVSKSKRAQTLNIGSELAAVNEVWDALLPVLPRFGPEMEAHGWRTAQQLERCGITVSQARNRLQVMARKGEMERQACVFPSGWSGYAYRPTEKLARNTKTGNKPENLAQIWDALFPTLPRFDTEMKAEGWRTTLQMVKSHELTRKQIQNKMQVLLGAGKVERKKALLTQGHPGYVFRPIVKKAHDCGELSRMRPRLWQRRRTGDET